MAALKSQIDDSIARREVLSNSSLLAQFGAGIFDPINLVALPFGGPAVGVGRSALRLGAGVAALETALDAARQTQLQQQYEPYQRAEFLANLYAAGPKSQSGITMTTQPGTSPLAQSIGTGLGAFTAYQAGQQQ